VNLCQKEKESDSFGSVDKKQEQEKEREERKSWSGRCDDLHVSLICLICEPK
jgi:hypothetical protein